MKGLMRAVVLVVGCAACGGSNTRGTDSTNKDVSSILALTGDPASGNDVFQGSCAATTCHGPDGDSGASTSPKLSDIVPMRDDTQLAQTIKYGTLDRPNGLMAPTGLSDQDIADVIAYLRQTFP